MTKKLFILKTSSLQMLKYNSTSGFQKTNSSYKAYCSSYSCKFLCKILDAIIFILHNCKDEYQYVLKIHKIDCNLQNRHIVL